MGLSKGEVLAKGRREECYGIFNRGEARAERDVGDGHFFHLAHPARPLAPYNIPLGRSIIPSSITFLRS